MAQRAIRPLGPRAALPLALATVCLALYTLPAITALAAPNHQSVENAEIADAAGSNTNNRAEVPTYAGEGARAGGEEGRRGPAPGSARALGGGEPLTPNAALIYAFVAAWNAGDADAVTLLFSPDAQIRQRSPWIEDIGEQAGIWDVYGTAFVVPFSALHFDHGDIVWAAGRPAIRSWVAGLLRDGHHVEIDSLHPVADDRLAWEYRASTAAQRRITGVGPTAGHAEATIRGAALAGLTVETDLTSALRRIREVMAASEANTAALQLRAPPPVPPPVAASTHVPPPTPALHIGPEDGDSLRLVILALGGAGAFLLTRRRLGHS